MKALSQEKKKQILFICVVVLLVLVVFGLTIGACFLADKSKSEKSEANMSALLSEETDKALSGDVLHFENINTDAEESVPPEEESVHSVFVEISKPIYLAGGSGTSGVSYTLTATVLPATAVNKNVTWAAVWADSSNTSAVSTYLTVTPSGLSATVTCLKPFSGNIIVSCTTVESGFEADCVVTFKGIPTSLNLAGDVNPDSASKLKVMPGRTYNEQIVLSNVFNQVGSEYNVFSYSLTGVGQFKVCGCDHYNTSGNDVWYESTMKTVDLDTLKDQFITVTQTGNSITITTIKSIEIYYKTKTRADGGRTWSYSDKFYEYVSDCYFTLGVREAGSGLYKEFIINFDPTLVTGVTLSKTTLTF